MCFNTGCASCLRQRSHLLVKTAWEIVSSSLTVQRVLLHLYHHREEIMLMSQLRATQTEVCSTQIPAEMSEVWPLLKALDYEELLSFSSSSSMMARVKTTQQFQTAKSNGDQELKDLEERWRRWSSFNHISWWGNKVSGSSLIWASTGGRESVCKRVYVCACVGLDWWQSTGDPV